MTTTRKQNRVWSERGWSERDWCYNWRAWGLKCFRIKSVLVLRWWTSYYRISPSLIKKSRQCVWLCTLLLLLVILTSLLYLDREPHLGVLSLASCPLLCIDFAHDRVTTTEKMIPGSRHTACDESCGSHTNHAVQWRTMQIIHSVAYDLSCFECVK